MTSIEAAILGGKTPPQNEPSPTGHSTPDNEPAWSGPVVEVARHAVVSKDSMRSAISEEFRLLKRPLIMNAFQPVGPAEEWVNLIMITSAMPHDGKTFVALNLALSMAMETDSTVLLIDADVVRPELTNRLGLVDRPGLIDVLLDPDRDVGSVIHHTDVPRLRVIPAGRPHERSTELLASEQMRKLTEEVSSRYSDRMIILDSPPLLYTSEAGVLTHLVGQILLIAQEGKTPQRLLKEAMARLDPRKIVGAVLNKASRASRGGYYGAYHGADRD